MALTSLCPPCSGTGRKRVPGTGIENRDLGICPLCDGEGFIETSLKNEFYECVNRADTRGWAHRIPWGCASGFEPS